MTQRKFKQLAPLLSFFLILSLLCPTAAFAASPSVTAFGALAGDEFDYAAVMSEPHAVTQTVSDTAPLSKSELDSLRLYPGGIPFGVKFMTEGILVVGFCDIDSPSGKINPSAKAGLQIGDRIISAQGRALTSAAELTQAVEQSGGKSLTLVYTRDGERRSTSLTPAYSQNEKCYKTGIYVKDNGAGIGTVTYIDPTTLSFGGLGHGICEGESGRLVPIQRGSVVPVTINGAVKGQKGVPGEVKGYFRSGKIGTLLKNTDCGVYGVLASVPKGLPTQPLSLCQRDQLKEGKAYIYCTLDGGEPHKYEIEISGIDRSATAGKCFTVRVTDPALLQITGGIVQGMSGSPIIQNGKLVGAVTHVLINDPTTGYGIFIENMLNVANIPMAKAS